MITHTVIAALLTTSALAFTLPAISADTPGSNPSVANAPSAAERMAAARKAIEAKDWRKSQSELTAVVKDEPRDGTVKDGVIEVQGDHCDRVIALLQAQGHKVKWAVG